MIRDLYIIKFNEEYSETYDGIGVFRDSIIVEPYFKLEDALNRIRELIKMSDDIDECRFKRGSMLSTIDHYLIGEPYDEYTKVLQPFFPISMTINHNGDIAQYKSLNNGPLIWTNRDMTEYNGNYNIGDIVDVIYNGNYQYKAVIMKKPIPVIDYCKQTDYNQVWYYGGYEYMDITYLHTTKIEIKQ